MKRITLILIVATSLLPVVSFAQDPAPGPYYFVSKFGPGSSQIYWGGSSKYAGIQVIENYHLLATVLGDVASLDSQRFPFGRRLVNRENFVFQDGSSVLLQPFAYYQQIGNIRTGVRGLAIGPRLDAFLSDPLDGAQFDLSLPFRDPSVALSDRSALLRVSRDGTTRTWHTAVDLDVSGNTTQGFDVLAAADGIVEGNRLTGGSIVLRHTASNNKEFLTIYQHMVPESKRHWRRGDVVGRGQLLGRVQSNGYTHLHFGVAVKGPSRRINGTLVPELWYLIDPFGVYDYRRDRFSDTNYNYLPENTLDREVRGIRHAYVWRTNPPIGSLPRRLIPVSRQGSPK